MNGIYAGLFSWFEKGSLKTEEKNSIPFAHPQKNQLEKVGQISDTIKNLGDEIETQAIKYQKSSQKKEEEIIKFIRSCNKKNK